MNKVILNDIIKIISGGTPKTSIKEYWENGTIGWLSVTDFNDDNRYVYESEKKITELGVSKSNTKFLQKGDIIISARGTVGALAQIGKPMCFNQSCFGIRGKNNVVDTDFLYYALKNYVKNIVKRSQGSVFDTINLASFNLMELEIPISIHYQTKITKVLSDLDAKIEINNKINQELEAMSKLLYDYWFVQFDFPYSPPSEGCPQEGVGIGKPYKSSGGKMVYNEDLKRKIPEGWENGTFDNLGSIIGGSTPSKNENDNFCINGMPWITPKDLSLNTGKKFITKGELDASEKGVKNASLKILPEGTVLLSSRAPVGYMVIARNNLTTNQGFKSFVPNKGYSTAYIYYSVQSNMKVIEQNASGSTFKEISGGVLKSIKICLAEKNIREMFDEKVNSIFKRQNLLELENQQLTELRDWLLPMLMNGQVTVTEAAAQLGMVAEPQEKYKN